MGETMFVMSSHADLGAFDDLCRASPLQATELETKLCRHCVKSKAPDLAVLVGLVDMCRACHFSDRTQCRGREFGIDMKCWEHGMAAHP